MRKSYEKPALRVAGDLARVTRGASFAWDFDGVIFHRAGGGGGSTGS
jgi:hypothetical protein